MAPFATLPDRRRALLAERLQRGDTLSASELAREFALSEDAIRRDLRDLAAAGLCRRVYGGAMPVGLAKPIAKRRLENGAAKERLACAALGLISQGQTIFLDAGSTHEALARLLPADAGLTIVTHAPAIAAAALNRPGCGVVLLGGKIHLDIGAAIGAAALGALRDVSCDLAFIGVCAFGLDEGVTAFDPDDAAFKREAAARSRRVAALVGSDKLQERAPYRALPSEAFTDLVFDHDADVEIVATASGFAAVRQAEQGD